MSTRAHVTGSGPPFDAWATTCGAMAEGIALVDRDGKVTRHNASFARVLRLPDEVIDGRLVWSLWELWGPRPTSARPYPFERMRASRRVETSELSLGDRWVHVSASPILDTEGALLGAVYVVTDVTDRKAAERALRESEEEYRTTFELSSVALAQLDPLDGRFLRVNTRLAGLVGYDAGRLCRMRLADVAAEDGRAHADEALERLRTGAIEEHLAEQQWRRADGTLLSVRVAARLIRQADGHPLRVVAVIEDISEQKRVEAQRRELLAREQCAREAAEAANRAKDDFLTTVSHELRTPLQAVLAWTRLLKTRTLPPEMVRDAVDVIERNASAQVRLIEDLLDTARIEKGKLRLEERVVDLVAVVRDTIASVIPLAAPKTIEIRAELPPGVIALRADPDRLRQIVWNLLTNAVKFTPASGHVDVVVLAGEREVVLDVRDSGEGIPADFLPHVFEPFRQLESSPTRRHRGLGIGLTLVRQLVELHHGRVSVASEGVGRGATFTVRLPLAEPEAVEAVAWCDTGSLALLAGLVALVIDDDPDRRAGLAAALRAHGARTLVASSTAHAVPILHHQKPDVLVADVPERDGLQLVEEASQMHDLRPVIVAVTAVGSAATARRVFDAGFDAYLPRPIDEQDLAWAVRELIRERRTSEPV